MYWLPLLKLKISLKSHSLKFDFFDFYVYNPSKYKVYLMCKLIVGDKLEGDKMKKNNVQRILMGYNTK